jgi:hypothetical protein
MIPQSLSLSKIGMLLLLLLLAALLILKITANHFRLATRYAASHLPHPTSAPLRDARPATTGTLPPRTDLCVP